jgi:FkbM family methyltransferase
MNATVKFHGREVTFCDVNPDDYIEGTLLNGAWFESTNLDFIRRLGVGGTYVDVGAYVGTASLFFGLFCHASRVYAFEPHPQSYAKLVSNLEANGVKNCTPCNVALSDVQGRAAMFVPNVQSETWPLCNFGGARLVPGNDVRVVTLDSLLLTNVRLMKIDAEGMELKILHGAVKTLATVEHLFVEILTPEAKASVFEFLHSQGFCFLALVGYNEFLYYFARMAT